MPSSEPTQPHFENQRHKSILKRFFVTDTALNFSCFSGTGSTQNIITALLQLLIVADRNRGAAVDFVLRLPETDVCWLFVKKKKKKRSRAKERSCSFVDKYSTRKIQRSFHPSF